MARFNFAIIASGLDPEAMDFADRFFEAGCGDATLSFQKGVIVLEFEREARSFLHAIASAMSDVSRAGATVKHIEPDYLVNLSDIAERSSLSRAAISLFAKGERGKNFPAPIARVTTESPLWDWVEVARWMHQNQKVDHQVVVEAEIVREANCAIRASEGFEKTAFAEKVKAELCEAA